MTRTLLPFVPSTELAALLAGSFQVTTARVADALREESSRLFSGRSATLLGVFPTAAVVLVEGGTVVRLRYGQSEAGVVHFTGTEDVSVTVVTEQNVRRYVQREARAAADLFVRGLVDQANEKIIALAPLVDQASVLSDDDILQGLTDSRATRLWKQTLDERADKVRSFLSEETLPPPIAPKFARLHDGSTTGPELEKFKPLVQDDIEHLVSRLMAVEAQASGALHAINLVREQAGREGGEEAIASLEAFAADLLSDVTQVREFVSEAVAEFGSVDRIAKVFDSIASEVTSFEVAGAFVAKTVTRLT